MMEKSDLLFVHVDVQRLRKKNTPPPLKSSVVFKPDGYAMESL